MNQNNLQYTTLIPHKEKSHNNTHLYNTRVRPIPDKVKYNYHKRIVCANCDELGHIVSNCENPITSFGIISFKIVYSPEDEEGDLNAELIDLVNNNVYNNKKIKKNTIYPMIKFLLIQRRQTMGFIDVLRGRYHYDIMKDKNKTRRDILYTSVDEMTRDEKQSIYTQPFDSLWDQVWLNKESRVYKNEKSYAKRHFNDNLYDIKDIIKNSTDKWNSPELGFPKGRKNTKENNLECARREFAEETGYTYTDYSLVKNKREPVVFKEIFEATNHVWYSHIYYLAQMDTNIRYPLVDKTNDIQAGEVNNIGWFRVEEAFELIRNYDLCKKQVLIAAYKYLMQQQFI
jgi:8-oxo-dGTP pyrophosphatase MutT (NUDIX family)